MGETTVTLPLNTPKGLIFEALQSVLAHTGYPQTIVNLAIAGGVGKIPTSSTGERYTFKNTHYDSLSISGVAASLSFSASAATWQIGNSDDQAYNPPASTDAGAPPSGDDAPPADSSDPDPDVGGSAGSSSSDADGGVDVDGGFTLKPSPAG